MVDMVAVGLRELKARLSAYVRKAREGETVLVTDRGQVVAELRAPSMQNATERAPLDDLVQSGALQRGLPNTPEVYEPSDLSLKEGTSGALLGWLRGGGGLPREAVSRRKRGR